MLLPNLPDSPRENMLNGDGGRKTVGLISEGTTYSFSRFAAASLAGGVLLAQLVERLTLRPLIGQPVLATIMMTLALAQILQGVVMLIWGGNPHPLPIFVTQNELGLDVPMKPIIVHSKSLIGGNIILKVQLLWSFGIAMAGFAAFALFFRFTGAGLSMRAAAEDHQLAQSVGLKLKKGPPYLSGRRPKGLKTP